MSRVGKQPIIVPSNVDLKINDKLIVVSGPKGQLEQLSSDLVKFTLQENLCLVERLNDSKRARSEHGLIRSLVSNMIEGVTEGFEIKLELIGIGYKVQLQNQSLVFNIGFSHQVEYELPQGIEASLEGNNITIKGINKQQVGQVAASIRMLKKPEPYKGKGIRYRNEQIRKKAGKGAKANA